MLQIVTINKNNEPFDIDHVNIKEEVFFTYKDSSTSATSGLVLSGSEFWVWNFDEGFTNGTDGVSDQKLFEINGFSDPISTIFYRPGNRTVSVNVFNQAGTNGTLLYSDSINFNIFEFPSEIIGTDYAQYNSNPTFNINSIFLAQTYKWIINGKTAGTNGNTLTINNFKARTLIECTIINGIGSVILSKICIISTPNTVFGKQYESDITPNLMFFNKEGDNLNFEIVTTSDGIVRWEGDMIFDPNGSDTFKTIGLYILEHVNAIKLTSDDLILNKMQIFNQYGADFEPQWSTDLIITNIEAVNNGTNFYSKWIESDNIQIKIPLGAEIYFRDVSSVAFDPITGVYLTQNPIQEFNSFSTSGFRTYTVVGNRKDAIMVLTDTSNDIYNMTYGTSGILFEDYNYGSFRDVNNKIQTVLPGMVKCFNTIKLFDTQQYDLEWNEPEYSLDLYDQKKISIVNSQKNDGIYTITYVNNDIVNIINPKIIKLDCVDIDTLIPDTKFGFKIDIKFKTNRVLVSSTPVDFLPKSDNPFLNDRDILVWSQSLKKDFTPNLFKTGVGFFFENLNSIHNLDFLFEVNLVDKAIIILTPQTTDDKGFKIILQDFNTIASWIVDININSKTNYTLIEGIDWQKGKNINESAFNLANAINNKVSGVTVISNQNEVWVWEIENNKFSLTSPINNSIFILNVGILTDNNPIYGIVADQWVSLNNSIFDGYIHHRVLQGNFHILYFQGIYPNQTPIWHTLPVDNKIVWVNSNDPLSPTDNLDFVENIISDCYLDSNIVSFSQSGDTDPTITSDILIQRFINKFSTSLSNYGLDLYQDLTELCLARNFLVKSLNPKDDYLDIIFYKDNTLEVNSFLVMASTNGTAGTNIPSDFAIIPTISSYKTMDILQTTEPLLAEYNHNYGKFNKPKYISNLWERKIIIKDIDSDFGFLMNINGIDYPVSFDAINTILTGSEEVIVDVEATLKDWGNTKFSLPQNHIPNNNTEVGRRYFEVLESLGVLTWLEKSVESYVQGQPQYDTLVLQAKYPNVLIDYVVSGTLNKHKILHSDIEFKEIGIILTITINSQPFSTAYQGSIPSTLVQWITDYSGTLLEQEIIVDHFLDSTSGTNFIDLNNNILRFSTLREKTNFSYTIWVGKTPSPGKDLYIITNWRPGTHGITISGNEIDLLTGTDLEDLGYSTGMITALQGSVFPLNNQEYNILSVSPTHLGLSYQGPFWDNNDTNSFITSRSGFDWYLYDQNSSGIGVNLIINSTFDNNSSSWWIYNDTYIIFNNRIEFFENLGINTPTIDASEGMYTLSFNTYNAGTSGHFGSTGGQYEPTRVSIYRVNSPNSFTLIFQDTQSIIGAYSKDIFLPSIAIKITFETGLSNGYINLDNIDLIKLPDASTSGAITLSSRDFLRYPRERFVGENPIQFNVTWLEQDETSMFFYDFSGDQLNIQDNGIYQYKGITPLIDSDNNVFLNTKPNRDLTKIKDLKYQQTIFDQLTYDLILINSETNISPLPTPLQIFSAYNATEEGYNTRTLQIFRLENINLTVTTHSIVNNLNQTIWKDVAQFNFDRQEIYITEPTINFITAGFKVGQRIRITGKDINSTNNQAVFKNSGFEGEITLVNVALIRFTPINKVIVDESTLTTTRNILPPFRTKQVVIEINLEVLPQEIARIQLKGQTEIEDERFKVMLDNFGYNIKHKDIFIFKEYDILESGVDWIFLNQKRKEMLLVYPEIYNFLGSYKSLVNAINYFGYNDLQLYEYYLNVDKSSKGYNKLSKIEIPDIFDNTVPGFTPTDYIIQSLPNDKYVKTKLFNLTYLITDIDGNFVLAYSLNEVITKLLGLKRWLTDNIIPLETKIRDITGRGDTSHSTQIWNDVKFSRKFRIQENLTAIDFTIEAYLQPVVNNSMTYNLHLEFFTNNKEDIPDFYTVKITTFSAKPDINTTNFKIKSVRTINYMKTDYLPINFSADRILDPFILIEVECDNGYGAKINVRKSFNLETKAFIS